MFNLRRLQPLQFDIEMVGYGGAKNGNPFG
jgi:hypothetical protein